MNIMRWDPFREFDLLSQQLTGDGRLFGGSSFSATDIYTIDDKELVVEVHLPNFKTEEVAIDINEGALEIRAEHREQQKEDERRKYVMRESSSSYYRRIGLPRNIDEQNIQAHFENGVLSVRIPYKELPRPTRIQIGASSGETAGKQTSRKNNGKKG